MQLFLVILAMKVLKYPKKEKIKDEKYENILPTGFTGRGLLGTGIGGALTELIAGSYQAIDIVVQL